VTGPQRIGHAFPATRPERFMPLPDFEARMDAMIDRLKDSDPAIGCDEVLVPGEPEARRDAQRSRTGLPITAEVVAALEAAAVDLRVAMPPRSPRPLH
jgi:LDH2 family malate/lactate/ureidoglycolate dehydrogenase